MNSQKHLADSQWREAREVIQNFPDAKATLISRKYLMKAKNIMDLVIHPVFYADVCT